MENRERYLMNLVISVAEKQVSNCLPIGGYHPDDYEYTCPVCEKAELCAALNALHQERIANAGE